MENNRIDGIISIFSFTSVEEVPLLYYVPWYRGSIYIELECESEPPLIKYFFAKKHCDEFDLVSLFNGIWTFVGYLMPRPFSKKNSSGTI